MEHLAIDITLVLRLNINNYLIHESVLAAILLACVLCMVVNVALTHTLPHMALFCVVTWPVTLTKKKKGPAFSGTS